MKLRGIRGAINLDENTAEAVMDSSKLLLSTIIAKNEVEIDDIASIVFTATDDITAEYPAYAAREMGMNMVPLLCSREMNVNTGMKLVIRVLMLINTEKKQNEIKHQYLGETKSLRSDIMKGDDDGSCRDEI